MIAQIEQKQNELAALCRKYGVRRLEIFGSAVSENKFDPERSDLDFLVEFDHDESMGAAYQYFGLLDELHALFERDVQLVTTRSLRNPYFIASINATRELLYES